jgi:hypothetical protein
VAARVRAAPEARVRNSIRPDRGDAGHDRVVRR